LKKKRWRLQLGDRRNAEKLVGEIRRRIGAEERDVDIDEVRGCQGTGRVGSGKRW
jgi:hypothetical protein